MILELLRQGAAAQIAMPGQTRMVRMGYALSKIEERLKAMEEMGHMGFTGEFGGLPRQGEALTTSVDGEPAVELLPVKPHPVFGAMAHWPEVSWTAFAPLSDEELAEWGL